MKLTSITYILLFYILLPNSIHSQIRSIDVNQSSKSFDWWMHKNTDSLASVNLIEAFTYIVSQKLKPTTTIVAVLDTDFDFNHGAFNTNTFYKNHKESINKKDDDNNGYIDDIHGWNFLGDTLTGKGLPYTLMEKTRILRKFTKAQIDDLYDQQKVPYSYEDVKKSYDETVGRLKTSVEKYKRIEYQYPKVMDTLKYTLKTSSITQSDLENYQTDDDIIKRCINYALYFYKDGTSSYKEQMKTLDFKRKSLEVCMNLTYDNRVLIGDEPENINDTLYGSPIFGKNLNYLSHGTKVTGIITSSIQPLGSIKTTDTTLQIMPITISGVGDYLDKDLSLSIRYAVDNGAKIINLSQSKLFSMNENFVDNAIQYASDKDVLIIKSAGNDNTNKDVKNSYPNDVDDSGKEIFNNLMIVGSNDKFLNKNLKASSSDYGKESVDIFAPGVQISTTTPFNKYATVSGTSYATPVVSSIAVLIRSLFPKLSAKQVKQILMDSGTSYDIEVEIEQEDGSKKLVPFSELSKSGKVVNAYNALLMAEQMSKQ